MKRVHDRVPVALLPFKRVLEFGYLLLVGFEVTHGVLYQLGYSLLVVPEVPHDLIIPCLPGPALLVDVLPQALQLLRQSDDGGLQTPKLVLHHRQILALLMHSLLVELQLGCLLGIYPPVANLTLGGLLAEVAPQLLQFALEVLLHGNAQATLLFQAPLLLSDERIDLRDGLLHAALRLLQPELLSSEIAREGAKLLTDELPLRRHVLSLLLANGCELGVPHGVLPHSGVAGYVQSLEVWLKDRG
mmetsp:Transcript_88704/g.206437  ORF Transcript_88704/g.206437 Transcript_88704/m.206437 type:complete len:245 (+) Transcript_88704:1460-2194(+)